MKLYAVRVKVYLALIVFLLFVYCLSAQSHSLKSLTDSSDNYTKDYILKTERNMIEPMPTLNGRTDVPGVIQSIQTLTLNKPSGDIIAQQNKKQFHKRI